MSVNPGLIVATSREIAEQAALLVTATYEDSDEKPIVTIEDGIAKKSFYSTDYDDYEHVVGDPDEALKSAKNVVSGTIKGGVRIFNWISHTSLFNIKIYYILQGMRHFYMEKQSTLAYVDINHSIPFESQQFNIYPTKRE